MVQISSRSIVAKNVVITYCKALLFLATIPAVLYSVKTVIKGNSVRSSCISTQTSLGQKTERDLKYDHDNPKIERELKYVHDDPRHVWHWTRENPPCEELSKKQDCGGNSYADLYHQFHEEGWVVFVSCSLQKRMFKSVVDRAAEYTKTVQGGRIASPRVKAVKDLSIDPDTLELVEFLHGGRRAFPFQTLNFPMGTQQDLHSDLVYFDTEPRTLMTAAWVALEDMNKDNGPLRFFPKSHQWGTWDFEEMGLHNNHDASVDIQTRYGVDIEKAMKKAGLKEAIASDLKKGQTFIWAAGLVHGGSKQNNMSLTRLSQVTHYFFEGSKYYWEPRTSDLTKGKITYHEFPIKGCMPQFNPRTTGGEEFHSCADGFTKNWLTQE